MITPVPPSFPLSTPTTSLQPFLESIEGPLFIFFIASPDHTHTPWCSDVRAAIPVFERVFSEKTEDYKVLRVEVGSKDEWKNPDNVYRKEWGLTAIPTLGRYEIIDVEGQKIVAVRMLVEGECIDEEKLRGIRDSS